MNEWIKFACSTKKVPVYSGTPYTVTRVVIRMILHLTARCAGTGSFILNHAVTLPLVTSNCQKNDTTPHGDSLFFDTIIPYIAFSNVLELVAISTCTKCAVSTAVNGLPFNCIELLLIIIDKCITASASGQVESHKSFRVKFQQSLQRQVSS